MISIGIRIIKTFGAFGGLIDILGVSRVPAAVAKVNHRGRFMLRAALNNGDNYANMSSMFHVLQPLIL